MSSLTVNSGNNALVPDIGLTGPFSSYFLGQILGGRILITSGLSASTVEPGRPSSSDCMVLPDRLDFSRCPVPPDCLTDFSVDTKYPVTVLSELSPSDRTGKRRLLWGGGMSFTEENPENSNNPEPDEGFKEPLEPLESWMSGLSDIRMTLTSEPVDPLEESPVHCRSRYRICTGLTQCSGGMGSWPMFPGSWVFVYSRASRCDRPTTVYRRCFFLLLHTGSTFHRLVFLRFLLILSHCWKNIKKKKMFQLIFQKVET